MGDKVQKVAVITGASQGIGEALVAAYRELGYAVVANSRSIKPSEDVGVLTVQGDIGDPATAEQIISQGLGEFGRIDTLVNNAGVFISKPFTDYTAEDYANIIAVNLTGFYAMTQRSVAPMLEQGGGHVVNITTSLVNHANSNVPSVLASLTKGGLDAATRSLAIEYASRGIRVNGIGPGATVTPINRSWIDDPVKRAAVEKHIPMRRAGTSEEMAAMAAFLCSDEAAYITGQTVFIDGGLTLFPSFETTWSSE